MNWLVWIFLILVLSCVIVNVVDNIKTSNKWVEMKENNSVMNVISNTSINGSFSSTSVGDKSVVKINGKTYTGKGNVSIINGVVKIGNEVVSGDGVKLEIAEITIVGDVGNIESTMDVNINGSVNGDIINARDVDCDSNINGSVMSARDVACIGVGKDVIANRDVACQTVKGKVTAGRDCNGM